MQYQTIDQIRQRCSDELPGFDALRDDALLRVWVWDALRLIDTDRLGVPTDAEVRVINGRGQLPADFLGIIGVMNAPFQARPLYHVSPGTGELRGYPDATVSIRYRALPLDEQGYPYILDAAEMAVMTYIDWKFTALAQKKQQMASAFGFRIDSGLNRENERLAKENLSAVRGDLNMLSELEVEHLRRFRQNLTMYRNG